MGAKVNTYLGRLAVGESVADRLALIRQAIGTIAKPISLEALGERVGFDKYKMSRIASGAQEMKKSDAVALASQDPLRRGPSWLMFGANDEDQGGQPAVTEPPIDFPPTIRREIAKKVSRLEADEVSKRRVEKALKRKPGGKGRDRSAQAV